MIIDLLDKNEIIKNPVFRKYSAIYTSIYRQFLEDIANMGIVFSEGSSDENLKLRKKLVDTSVKFRNNEHSLYLNTISPSCLACQKGKNSMTFFISLRCTRNCYFCFNENQEEYEYYLKHTRDCSQELQDMYRNSLQLDHIALTGGEPLLHKEETIEFFRLAKNLYPKAETRLYTCGDLINSELLQDLADASLDEIRFSIKTDDSNEEIAQQLSRIELVISYIPRVMVEMPVIPGSLEQMKWLLQELELIGIYGINLLEFCFPFHNIDIFNEKGFKIKKQPYKVLYNYWYAGGLPVDGSEQECLQLLEYSLEQGFKMGVHYCSLENKHTGQIYQQNFGHKVGKFMVFSHRDYFYKTAKVFGEDVAEVLHIFKGKGYKAYRLNQVYDFLEFHPEKISWLKDLDIEIGLASHVMEEREGSLYQREVAIDFTTPRIFDYTKDI
ncbi:MAG TPA: radical SAM protein [Syntrophomonadaceae bacterium]|nr:radical SAM protein [Syntrophomonadaceae bacterium]